MPLGQTYRPAPHFPDLGEGFGDAVHAAKFPEAKLRFRNDRAAQSIGLETLTDAEWCTHFGHFEPLENNLTAPIAQRYHGHQFRHYNPDIGDGRGFLFAQIHDANDRLMDLGTKGSGTTPYSRSGDGRLTLKGGVREILASEMLEALGTYTSRTFSLVETGESLMRGDEPSPTRSSVMVRLTHGHIRIGTFQRHAYFSDTEKINQLVTYCLKHYYNVEAGENTVDNALTFLNLVMARVAEQAADLMAAGFVHGVLNTDNINITGEIFDFGPWRFLPHMDLNFTAAYFDETGLYAFGRQPDALHWNIYQLGGALADIAPEDKLKDVLQNYPDHYFKALRKRLLKRLGVKAKGDTLDDQLLKGVNDFLLSEETPYEHFFFDWFGGQVSKERALKSPIAAHYQKENYQDLRDMLQSYEPENSKALEHAYFKREAPCTMLIDEVESIWAAIAERDDWAPFHDKIADIHTMGEALR